MQLIVNFFNKSNDSRTKKSLLQKEIAQLKMENESLTRVLASEQSKNEDLEKKVEKKKAQLDYRVKISKEIEKKDVLEEKIQLQAKEIEALKKTDQMYQEGLLWYTRVSAKHGTILDPTKVKEFLLKERKETEMYRSKMLHMRKKVQKAQEKVEGDSKSWNLCEVCAFEFEDSEEKVPRILGCGHTVCHSCAGQLASQTPGYVQCPFDRLFTLLPGGNVEKLSKNLTILHQ